MESKRRDAALIREGDAKGGEDRRVERRGSGNLAGTVPDDVLVEAEFGLVRPSEERKTHG
jgi:hypothetical protein